MPEDDLILGDPIPEGYSILDVIDNQLSLIQTLHDIPPGRYDAMEEDVVRSISKAFEVIYKAQIKLKKEL